MTAQSAADRAYAAVRTGIIEGTHRPGDMLGEAALAADLGVSRTPVRTALVRLQDDGWITVYPKRGALVRGMDERAVREMTEARVVLESAGVRRASSRARRELAAALVERIAEQRAALVRADVAAFIESTVAFHRSFVEVGGNGVLLELNDRLADRQRRLLFAQGTDFLTRCDSVVAEHEELAAALAADDPDRFTAALARHVLGEGLGSPG